MKAALLLVTFMSTASAMIIDCDFKVHSTYGYGCESNSIQNPKNANAKFCGEHAAGMSDSDVKYVLLKSIDVPDFPKGVAEKFSNIQTVNLDFSQLGQICHEDLKPFGSKLKSLMLSKNEIKNIPEDLFASTPNISYLYISSDKIKSIHKNAFEPLKSLSAFFAKFTSQECDLDEDATSQSEVKELTDRLSIQCFDSKVDHSCQPKDHPNEEGKCAGVKPPATPAPNSPSSPPSPMDESTVKPDHEESSDAIWWALGIAAAVFVVFAGILGYKKFAATGGYQAARQ